MVNPRPDAVWAEAVVGLVGKSGAVVEGGLVRLGYVDITGRAQVDSDKDRITERSLTTDY